MKSTQKVKKYEIDLVKVYSEVKHFQQNRNNQSMVTQNVNKTRGETKSGFIGQWFEIRTQSA